MNPSHFNVRMDRNNGEFWLVLEKPYQPIRRIRNITSHILGALCADLFDKAGTIEVVRDIKFDDGTWAQVSIRDMGKIEPESPQNMADLPDTTQTTATNVLAT